ncbi:MAG: hypothetical protein F6K54_08990 [Okeania sp. SIO3B5]|uniref:hypothetical protein n=1 Tax=Okeania sp. SIO3B5 TaxID=2607811 RepID=UPI001400355D|nr:hypothetical protein [Okeania sp. SIO3B5]NEO53203.1 hypothetical protein [Okeania sp. SIO3B5]
MPFSNYKNIAAVAKEYQIRWISANFVNEVEFPVPQNFRKELEFLFSHGNIYGSEYAICENLIYPILKEVWKSYYQKFTLWSKEVWKSYYQKFTLWSHETLTYDEKLSGKPDYIVTKLSPLGRRIFDKPYVLVVQAKQDKFEKGWGHFSYQLSVISTSRCLRSMT